MKLALSNKSTLLTSPICGKSFVFREGYTTEGAMYLSTSIFKIIYHRTGTVSCFLVSINHLMGQGVISEWK